MSSPGLQGLRPWMIQRVSAVYIALYLIYVTVCWLYDSPFTAANWHSWVTSPFNSLAIGLFIVAILWHAWIGVRDIILDYVPNVVARLLVLMLVGGTLIASGLWGIKALYMVTIQ